MPVNDWIDALIHAGDLIAANWPPKMPPPPLPPQPPTWTLGSPRIDVVIPCRGDELVNIPAYSDKPLSGGLMMTVTSCEKLLAGSKYDYRYYIVSNGNPSAGPEAEAFERAVQYVRDTGHLGKVLYENSVLSPPTARNIGAAAGRGDLIFFFDNHCLVHEGFFSCAVQTFETTGADILHGAIHGIAQREGQLTTYHYRLSLEDRFSLKESIYTPKTDSPYRIGVSGHGAFAVKRTVWEEIDGYWDGFVGFGGEECYLELKMAMMDKSNWLNPRMTHWHHAIRVRDYKRKTQLAAYAINMMASANIIGGNAWAERTANSFYKAGLQDEAYSQSRPWYNERLQTAIERSEDHRRWFDSKKQRTLDEQLKKFKLDGVAC